MSGLGWMIGGRNPKLTAEVGQRRRSNHLYWECRKEYDVHPEKPAWHFWKSISKIEQVPSARLNK